MSEASPPPSRDLAGSILLGGIKLLLLLLLCFGFAALAWLYPFHLMGLNPHLTIADWAHEADPALRAALSGNLFGMYGQGQTPLMMPLALLIRLPALSGLGYTIVHAFLPGISHINGWWINSVPTLLPNRQATINYLTDTRRYEVGAIGLMVLTAMIVVASLWYRASRQQRISAVVATLALLFVPLTGEALRWSHPEEILLAAMIMLALLAAGRGRWLLAAIAFALAFATKQPAWLAAPTLPFLFPAGWRVRGCAVTAGVAAVICAPFLLGHLSAVWASQNGQLSAVPSAADPQMHISLWGALGTTAGVATRWLLPALAVVLPVAVAWRRHWQLNVREGAGVICIILLARCVLDPFDISYYALPAVGAMIALEQNAWLAGTHPLRVLRWLRHIPLLSAFASVLLAWTSGAFSNNWYVSAIAAGSVGAWLAVLVVLALIVFLGLACLRRRSLGANRLLAAAGFAQGPAEAALGVDGSDTARLEAARTRLRRAQAAVSAAAVELEAAAAEVAALSVPPLPPTDNI